jgi:hypothetical protein
MDPRLKDWRWRCNNLYRIVDKNGKLVRFKENWIQKRINENRSRRKMILKYRQGGVTTGEAKKQLDFVSFGRNRTACIMADCDENLDKVFGKVKQLYQFMHPTFKPRLDRGGGSSTELRFPDINGKFYCALQVRGDTVHWLHISEAAFCKPDRVRAALETVPPKGIVTFESTPNGLGNHFYKRWIGKSDELAKLFFPWFFNPEYVKDGARIRDITVEEKKFIAAVKAKHGIDISKDQLAFRRSKQEDQQELFLQEYPEDDITCFLSSGGSALDLDRVKRMLDRAPEPIEDTGELKIWKPYDSSRVYACGADTAEGVGRDFSVGTIFDVETMEDVAQIRSNKWRPREFAHKLNELCKRYTKHGRLWPLLGVERNNHGHAVLLELEEHLDYPNLYYFKENENEKLAGWKTDSITRPIMVDAFIDGVENGTATINSRETLAECLTLIDNNGKIEAEEGENDDCVISSAIGIQMCIKARGSVGLYDDLQNKILLG